MRLQAQGGTWANCSQRPLRAAPGTAGCSHPPCPPRPLPLTLLPGRYGGEHKAPELQKEVVYGLTELHREAVAGARVVANPGCYPTSVQLPLVPLLAAGLLQTEDIIIDAKSGEGFFFFFWAGRGVAVLPGVVLLPCRRLGCGAQDCWETLAGPGSAPAAANSGQRRARRSYRLAWLSPRLSTPPSTCPSPPPPLYSRRERRGAQREAEPAVHRAHRGHQRLRRVPAPAHAGDRAGAGGRGGRARARQLHAAPDAHDARHGGRLLRQDDPGDDGGGPAGVPRGAEGRREGGRRGGAWVALLPVAHAALTHPLFFVFRGRED